MMKHICVIALCFAFVAVAWARPDGGNYTDEFDSLDEDEILNSERLFQSYFNCLKTGLKCPKPASKLREILPDALQTKCSKCTEVQKTKAPKIVKWIIKNKPNHWLEIEEIFDKEHIYRTEFADVLDKEGIVLPPLKN